MATTNISSVVSNEDLTALKTAIETINSKLPFLINLPDDQLSSLFKLGPKSADFVSDSLDAMNNFPQILAPSFDKTEFTKDANLFKQLSEIKMLLDSLSEKILDTHRQVGSEALDAALQVYAFVQIGQDRVPGLKSVADKLQERFLKAKTTKQSLN